MATTECSSSLPSCVLFDLDGTLVDSAPDLHLAAAKMNDQLGIAKRSIEEVRAWIGDGMKVLVERVLSGSQNPQSNPDLAAQGLEIFRGAYAQAPCLESRLYPGVRQTLDVLREWGLPLGVVTNKAHSFALPILRQLKIEAYFSVVVGGDTLPTCKPDAAPVLYAMSELNTSGRGVLVGDSEVDIRAAQAAKVPVVAVSYGYNRGREVQMMGADLVIDSMDELPEALTSLVAM